MNLSDSYKLVKNGIQSVSIIELIPNSESIDSVSNNYQCQVNIHYQEQTRQNILAALPSTQTRDDCCPICLVEFKTTHKLKRGRRCRHSFHSKCIKAWLNDESREFICPICRRPL